MKTLFVIFVASMFLLSIVAGGYAQKDAKAKPDSPAAEKAAKAEEKKGERVEKIKDRAEIAKERVEQAKERLKDRISDVKKVENLKEHELKVLEKVAAKKEKLEGLEKEKLEKLSRLPPGIAKKITEADKFENVLDKWKVKQVSREELKRAFVKREVVADKLKAAEDRVKEAGQKLDKAKADFKAKKEDFKKTKNVDNAKGYLLKLIESMAEKTNKIKARVEGSKDLSEDKAKEVLADLNSRLAKLDEWRTKAEAANTKEELKSLTKEIKDAWKHLDGVLKLHEWRLAIQHFAGILKQAERLDDKLNRWLTFAEKNNVTIPDKDAKVASFESKLGEARKSHEAIVSDFTKLKGLILNKTENVTDSEVSERKALVDSIQANLKAGKKSLKEAREILVALVKDVVKELKDKKPVTDSGKPIEIKEEAILDPTQAVEGVETAEGESTVAVAEEEEAVEL